MNPNVDRVSVLVDGIPKNHPGSCGPAQSVATDQNPADAQKTEDHMVSKEDVSAVEVKEVVMAAQKTEDPWASKEVVAGQQNNHVLLKTEDQLVSKGAIPKTKVPQGHIRQTHKIQPTIYKGGDNTVTGTNCVRTDVEPVMLDDVQNCIAKARHLLENIVDNVRYQDHRWIIQCNLSGPPGFNVRAGAERAYFQRTLPLQQDIRPFHIRESRPRVVGTIDATMMTDLVVNGIVSFRKTSDAIMTGIPQVSRAVADMLAPHLLQQLTVHDSSGFFTISYMIAMMIQDYENNGVNPVRPQIGMEDLFDLANVGAGQQDALEQAGVIITAMQEGRAMFDASKLTTADVNVLRLIARGPASLRPPVGHRRHVASYFEHAAIRICLMVRPNYNLPNFLMPSAAQAYAATAKFAVLLGSHDSLVKGFVRAGSLINGKTLLNMVAPNEQVRLVNDWMNSQLECMATTIPQIRCANPIWDFIQHGKSNFDRTDIYAEEFKHLQSMEIFELAQVSVLISAWASLGLSTLLNYFNIGGRELASLGLHPGVHGNATPLVRGLMFEETQSIPNYIPLALGFPAQTHDVVISPRCYIGMWWCNGGIDHNVLMWGDVHNWRQRWGSRVPYLNRPLALADGMKNFSHVWGVMSPPVTFNLSKEILFTGPPESRGWQAVLGDSGYSDVAESATPFVYQNYGSLAINALRQHHAILDQWDLTYVDVIKRATALTFYPHVGNDIPQPIYRNDLNYIEQGSLLSFDWHSGRVIAPVLSRDMMGAQVFDALQMGSSDPSPNAGISVPGRDHALTKAVGLNSVMSALNIKAFDGASTSTSTGN